MAKVLFFPWFLFRLSLAFLPTLVATAWIPLRRWENVLFSLISLSLVVVITLTLFPTPVVTPNPVLSTLTEFIHPQQTELENQLEIHLELYRQQPTSRDVLVNLALLYRALNQAQTADHYWAAAQKIDPNYGLFN